MGYFRLLCTPVNQRGSRYPRIEDRYDIGKQQSPRIAAVYDGHSGHLVAESLRKTLIPRLQAALGRVAPTDDRRIRQVITATFLAKDEQLHKSKTLWRTSDAGSTAVMALYWPSTRRLYLANLGDSRAVLYTGSRSSPRARPTWRQRFATTDHKPDRAGEAKRIRSAGGSVTRREEGNVPRVDGSLAVSRGFGDFSLKRRGQRGGYDPLNGKVTAMPEIKVVQLTPNKEYRLVLASDGLWDEFSNTGVGAIMSQTADDKVCRALTQRAREKGGDDDITVLAYEIKAAAAGSAKPQSAQRRLKVASSRPKATAARPASAKARKRPAAAKTHRRR